MNQIRRYALILLLCAGGWQPAPAQDELAPHRALDARYGTLLQQEGVTGFNVGIVANGVLVFAGAYGLAELGTDKRLTPDSVFHWSSVSKTLVAVAIMQLAEAGKLSLDDPVTEHVPYFSLADPRVKDITLRQLLSHTSGMPDVEDYEWDQPQHDPEALWRWMREQSDRELLFAPGTDRQFSNLGYELLGLVIEEVADESFEDYMKSHLFIPLQMHTTSFIPEEIPSALRVSGHVGQPERRIAPHYPYNRRHAPSSTLNSSILDMANFVIAMLTDGSFKDARILEPDSVVLMFSSAWQSPDDPPRLSGLGWNLGLPWSDIYAATHGGQDDGFRAFLYLAPERGVGIFVVSNDENAPVRLILRLALEATFPAEAEVLPEEPVQGSGG